MNTKNADELRRINKQIKSQRSLNEWWIKSKLKNSEMSTKEIKRIDNEIRITEQRITNLKVEGGLLLMDEWIDNEDQVEQADNG